MAEAPDLVALDRDVARAWRAYESWRAAILKRAPSQGDDEDDDPFAAVRHVAGQSTFERLRGHAASAAEEPLRHVLLRWVYALTQARIGRDLEAAWARAAGEESAALRGEKGRRVSWRDAWRGIVASRVPGEALGWLDAAVDVGPR